MPPLLSLEGFLSAAVDGWVAAWRWLGEGQVGNRETSSEAAAVAQVGGWPLTWGTGVKCGQKRMAVEISRW